MRLLFLGVHGRARSPSQRYRFEQFEPHLRSLGIEVEYSGVLDQREADVFYGASSSPAKARIALAALGRRAWSVLPRFLRSKPDVVFVQREAFFLFNEWAERLAAAQAPVVFDFDDAIWIHAISEANQRFAFLKNVEKIPRIARLARTVIVGNDFLATWARQHNSNVHVLPTCVDTDVYCPPASRQGRSTITIGWSGSHSTLAQLRLGLPVLERVKARLGDRVRFRVMGDPRFRHEALGVVGETWTPEAEVRFLQEMDIGLMPLPDDEWSKGKCGLKALTSMASGAATVLSPVGVNSTIVQNGVTGFLPKCDAEWVDVLCRLVDDAALRTRIGAAGRDAVVAGYSVKRWREPLAQLLLDAAA